MEVDNRKSCVFIGEGHIGLSAYIKDQIIRMRQQDGDFIIATANACKACDSSNKELEAMNNLFNLLSYNLDDNLKSLELLNIEIPLEPTIDQLKKQIKYSKNPLEIKMLNRQLNQMYKEQKGVR